MRSLHLRIKRSMGLREMGEEDIQPRAVIGEFVHNRLPLERPRVTWRERYIYDPEQQRYRCKPCGRWYGDEEKPEAVTHCPYCKRKLHP
jgi:DNA-directed RNA polymerase subunit RPC12/RpoP